MNDHREVPPVQPGIRVPGSHGDCDTRCGSQNGSTLRTAKMIFHQGRELFILFEPVYRHLGCQIIDHLLGGFHRLIWSGLGVIIPIPVLEVIHPVIRVIIQDVVGVCCCCILGKPNPA